MMGAHESYPRATGALSQRKEGVLPYPTWKRNASLAHTSEFMLLQLHASPYLSESFKDEILAPYPATYKLFSREDLPDACTLYFMFCPLDI